jgi:FkbM family methyltransferase
MLDGSDARPENETLARMPWWVRIRRCLRRIPLLGPILYMIWLYLFRGEGRTIVVENGPLKGIKLRQRMGVTTVLPDLAAGAYERDCLESLSRELGPGQVFYDVGAHTGIYSFLASRLVAPGGRVVAIEASARNAKEVRAGLRLNRILICEVVCVAVSDHVGTSMLLDPGNSSMYQLAEVSSIASVGRTAVRTTTLDHLVERYGAPDVLKMDIEGAEVLALRGAQSLLRAKKPLLLIEVHTSEIARELYSLLRGCGYTIHRLSGDQILDERWERFIMAR